VKPGELRVPVKYLAGAAGPLRQAAVAQLAGVALIRDRRVVSEAEPYLVEELRRVFLIFTR
jgi:hypothetical protein